MYCCVSCNYLLYCLKTLPETVAVATLNRATEDANKHFIHTSLW